MPSRPSDKQRGLSPGERLMGPVTGWTLKTAFIAGTILDDFLVDIDAPVEGADLFRAVRELVEKRNQYLLAKRAGEVANRFDEYRQHDDGRQPNLLNEEYVPKVDRKKLEP